MPSSLSKAPGLGLQIVYRNLRDLQPYAGNARIHSPAQKRLLRNSLQRYGWTNPMLIVEDTMTMLAGHGRLEVAIEMASARIAIPRNEDPWQGPTIDLSHLSEKDRRAYVLMDNKSALESTWDSDKLVQELGALFEDGVDLMGAGFDPREVDRLLGDDDYSAEPKAEAATKKSQPARPAAHCCPSCGYQWKDGEE